MSHTIVIFGASGDLTSRKLIPALYLLHKKGRLPESTRVVGVARTEFSHDAWREDLEQTTQKFTGDSFDAAAWNTFASQVYYQPGDLQKSDDMDRLASFLNELDGGGATRIYYLSTMPKLYPIAVEMIGAAGMADQSQGPRRVVIEKPFGTDLTTAQQLNARVHKVFAEDHVYRIDHYLGKETVQNLLVLRFGNSIFEPLWNRNYIDHVQITVAEEVVVGRRGGYYDTSGVMRDMVQNHLLQLMMITAMESPVRFDASMVRGEKVKVLQAIRPMHGADFAENTIRGQYKGYLSEEGVPADSQTATFTALKLWVDNWRWQGVPFYLRSGKAMSCRTTQIVIQYKEPPLTLFEHCQSMEGNRLVIQIQPAEGLQVHIQSKVPDAGMRTRTTDLDFRFRRQFAGDMPDAYQRLLLDAIQGDASLFARSDEVELAWGIVDPILAAWNSPAASELMQYEPGGWGPEESAEWMYKQGRQWFDVCPVLH
ncbi:glucose-6-phosphate dehydrogenase [Blastopirellula sp. JC732]|uniref:Glucose-6-phosphate 1-dehydrogenase n=1 Tax=Blastopirellula sediminis TaxID=2894196 RepID=A0A9X1MRS2_9BACT|nr:glucose-6-phosphate dehydrogenase [Blastopirellula sediminis]MCC9604518.1 glucose-6-phosphate dehydrogenase [Blastopirellula sediminis]MCC9632183.1 glucose-6-phosphate dehydrogenase [Blastopirellula sediminis]